MTLMMDFDRSPAIKAPVPELIDAFAWIRDPQATSVNGDMRGKGGMRFGGYEVGATYYEMKKLPGYFNLDSLRKDTDINALLKTVKEARNEAQGRQNFPPSEEALGKFNNYEFQILRWFTTIKGEKYLIELANRRSQIVRLVPLKKWGGIWPIVDRAFYPMAHDWDGVSIPDLTEDKQRGRAVLLNLGFKSAKSDGMPQYLFDQTKIKNKNDINWRHDKFIGIDGPVNNALLPVQKSTIHQYVNDIMTMLDVSAQRATAATELRQGIQSEKERTLGEQQLAASAGEIRFSMNAKVNGWSEKAFWLLWYKGYKLNFKEGLDEKIVRIQGPLAPIWRPLTRENIIATVDPDVKIESRIISETKRQKQLQTFQITAGVLVQNPDNNRRYIEKKLVKLEGFPKEEIDMMFPPTVDELQAEDENVLLNTGKLPEIKAQDDHKVHINIHAKANQNAQAMAHIRAHKKLMLVKRDRPDLFPGMMPQANPMAAVPQNLNMPTQPKEMGAVAK